MIQIIADKYKKPLTYLLFVLFYLQTIILPLHAAIKNNGFITGRHYGIQGYFAGNINSRNKNAEKAFKKSVFVPHAKKEKDFHTNQNLNSNSKVNDGGPTSPEASTFKAVGSDNLVNLFTGDFSYSIPLVDVGGYPVNLFYNGGITMEQEASWVGLGWNINPGTVNRNMRGVPDDFNGEDQLIQTQNVKPNRTWGGEVGVDGEALGIKKPNLNFSLGFSYNNYLGPALDLGAGISLAIPLQESIKSDKSVASKPDSSSGIGEGSLASFGLNAKLSSRSGLTVSPSLNVQLPIADNKANIGVGLSTSYNSRTGIKDLNINSQMSSYRYEKKSDGNYDRDKPFNSSASIGSSSISFARPTYIPTLRMPMEYSNYSGQLELGTGMFGLRGAAHAQGYYSESRVPDESKVIYKPLIGFIYSEKANTNKDAVMDFNRLNDAEVTPNTPVISAPQYAYDIFSIQGEGTGGTIRAYRGDLGFMRDNETTSKDKNISIGFDIAVPGHFGGNWNIVSSPTKVGGWNDGNNTLRKTMMFQGKSNNSGFENVYFRNPGEATVTNAELIDRIGGDNLVRFKLGGSNVNPRLESQLELFDKNTLSFKGVKQVNNSDTSRDKRTQVTTILTAAEASVVGLEKNIRNYSGTFDDNNNIEYNTISRTYDFRRGHHISEIDVLEQNGMRYVYGIPVYNIRQKDFTFSTANAGDTTSGIVTFSDDEPTVHSPHMANTSKLDGYMMSQETPAYASSFLLSGLLSPDYVDVTGDGITEDDLGNAVKFDYTKSADNHKWRTPRAGIGVPGASAHFNEGLKSEKKDNKGIISYGEREVWYLGAIESKSMVAIFKTSDRDDAKGVIGEMNGTINPSEQANKKLDTILLYTKAEIKAKGINNARPIKSVVFTYSYSLCKGTPDNKNGAGKLTLASIYFIYNGQPRSKKDQYIFNYGDTAVSADNPVYAHNASDRWGTYKSPDTNPQTNPAANPSGLTNADYPYTSSDKGYNDQFAAAWSLKKILLPSGAQMEVQYEADDYAYVQDRRACSMFDIYGFGNSTESTTGNGIYNTGLTPSDNYYVYVKLPEPLEGTDAISQKKEIFDKYLESLNQLAFKLWINMPKGPEPLTVYAGYDDYGLCTNNPGKGGSDDIIYIKLQPVDNQSPLSKSAIDFITENLPDQAFEGYDIEVNGIQAFLEMAGAMLTNFKSAFRNVNNRMRSEGKARTVVLGKSLIRLANPYKTKYGGGVRVKQITVKDNWERMKGKFTSVYGQDYDYTTTENTNGKEAIISSGVASYEPGIGSEENPFREIIAFNNKMPLAPAQYGAIETPVLDGLYPAPSVGYSKITVRSIHRNGTHGDSILRSAIGKQVTEFYTARDYPTVSSYTGMSNMEYHFNSFFNLLYKEITDRKVVSQGFLVETNDMHGKMKKQSAYSESDENTPLSYSYYTYKNTGKNGLNDKVDFVHNDDGGTVSAGNIGIDIELMTDVREFKTQVNDYNGQIQSDFFTFVPWPIFLVPMLPIKTYTENKYRSVTCTKLINYHAIADSLIVMDKGSVISTQTVAYDAETGAPVITKTANEFNDPVYHVTYPAYWAYSGMSPAYKNIDRQFSDVSFYDGKIVSGADTTAFESGDELYVTSQEDTDGECIPSSPDVIKLWAYDKSKDTTALTVSHKDLVFIDNAGKLFTKAGVDFRIIRSGKRNLLNNAVASITTMANPIVNAKLIINEASKTVAASAVEFKEKWQVDNDVIQKYSLYFPPPTPAGPNLLVNGDFESGNTGFFSGYGYTTQDPTDGGMHGWYTVSTCCLTDHTTGSGKKFYADGSETTQIVWQQTVSVTPYTNYDFSAWSRLVSTENPANLSFKINNVTVGATVPGSSWKQFKVQWNSNNNTTATIVIYDVNILAAGNDFALDDISFSTSMIPTCTSYEVPDCNGYLEKSLNPYLKGLIGNYKPYRNYVYYGNRNDSDIAIQTAIRKNGYLKNFSNYWYFNADNNLLPDHLNPNWVWNTELTKVNAKGQELETHDALDRYTSSQYGFNKNMPVAIVQNARYNESFNEGFEDYNYTESINQISPNNCGKKHIDFTDLPGSSISIADSMGFKAHSGRYALGLNASVSVSKSLLTDISVVDSFELSMKMDTVKHLSDPGAILTRLDSMPATAAAPSLSATNLGMSLDFTTSNVIGEVINNSSLRYYQLDKTTQYIEITVPGTYTFNLSTFQEETPLGDPPEYIFNMSQLTLTIKNLASEALNSFTVNSLSSPKSQSIYLTCGTYLIEGFGSVDIQRPYDGMDDRFHAFQGNCSYSSNVGVTSYKSLSTQNGCISTKPIPANDSMINPVFKLIRGEHMQFSAWVREDCDSVVCYKTGYLNNHVELQFPGTGASDVLLKPYGNIIEGWQKIEGEFTVPANATTVNLLFSNSSNQKIYFDDIRIHPFHANMKSYVYDPHTLKLSAELDENNYATFYEYDEEGQLIRVKKETSQGIKTINETRAAQQKALTDIQ